MPGTLGVDFGPIVDMLRRVGVNAEGSAAPVMTRMVGEHNRAMRQRFRPYTGTKGDKLQRRSGNLARAMRFRGARPGDTTASSFVAGPLPYAQIHEHGGTITPTRRRYLTIPMPGAMTAAGVVRLAARPQRAPGGGWRTQGLVPGAESRKSWIMDLGKGPRIYVRGRDGRPLPLWSLKKRVKIPPRLEFFGTWERLGPDRARLFARWFSKVVDDAARSA